MWFTEIQPIQTSEQKNKYTQQTYHTLFLQPHNDKVENVCVFFF